MQRPATNKICLLLVMLMTDFANRWLQVHRQNMFASRYVYAWSRQQVSGIPPTICFLLVMLMPEVTKRWQQVHRQHLATARHACPKSQNRWQQVHRKNLPTARHTYAWSRKQVAAHEVNSMRLNSTLTPPAPKCLLLVMLMPEVTNR